MVTEAIIREERIRTLKAEAKKSKYRRGADVVSVDDAFIHQEVLVEQGAKSGEYYHHLDREVEWLEEVRRTKGSLGHYLL